MKMMKEIDGGVTAAKGFRASGVHCGIRKAKKDVAIIVSDVPAAVSAVFTLNRTQAAPIVVNKALMQRSKTCRAIVANSGNANACTGEQGMIDAWKMVRSTAHALGIREEEVLVASTGIIGQYLPIERVLTGIAAASQELSYQGSQSAAEAIMTTDTFAKSCAISFEIDGKEVRIGGIAKGSGMIAPNMATMLGFITTDAKISGKAIRKIFRNGVNRSFNRISVDGDMSTNDMAVVMANGLAGNDDIQEGTEAFEQFASALEFVMVKLSKLIARDGEGATKLIEVEVMGATTEKVALIAARSVANSNLVKTAMHGEDANWGRILAAIGYSGIEFEPNDVELAINGLPFLEKNYGIVLDEVKAKAALAEENISVTIDLNQGEKSAKFWTCDLSKQYVHINASYRS
ncbi:MAG TPA: bifunctional glutamate N-acetyltransferase/amino-acid acetyltransferase ArgJ [Candidatus Kapabacteria bacterium]|nr:bifunctional glutamate N-acetyltransferase/amino-acid acetyltransferase ArgJ [Candidatus Kapabacteria bacterium]